MRIRNSFGLYILRYTFLSLLLLIGLITIIGSGKRQLTSEELAYDRRVNNQNNNFTLPNEQAEEAWSRAHQFIASYSNFRIQMATKYVIQTYMSDDVFPKYGYSVTRTISGNNTSFSVKCFCSNEFAVRQILFNARALAHYMITQELMPRRINR